LVGQASRLTAAYLIATERVDFGVLGKPPELLFGKGELAVDGDLKNTADTFDEFDFGAVFLFKSRPRTEGSRKVVSRNAVFDPDLHRRSLSQKTTVELYHNCATPVSASIDRFRHI
jgi:hypothetical protein